MRDARQRTRARSNWMRPTLVQLVVIVLHFAIVPAQQKTPGPHPNSAIQNTQSAISSGTPRYGLLNINNITTWHRSDGLSNHSPGRDNGVHFPRGTGNTIYQDGLVWGGRVYSNPSLSAGPGIRPLGDGVHPVRIGGGTYGIGTRAGRVVGMGVEALAADPLGPDVRVYRIRRDYASMNEEEVREDARLVYEHESILDVTDEELAAVRDQYAKDWNEWPVEYGAPYIDRNGNGIYDPSPPYGDHFTVDSLIAGGYDEPGIGPSFVPADQVLWMVYNDLSDSDARNFAGSHPLGIEIQKTVWGYRREGSLGDMYLMRHRFINKGGIDTSDLQIGQIGTFWIDSMYFAMWSDLDIGRFSDDASGTDTVLDMTYSYNFDDNDAIYATYALPPPAIGYCMLAGPLVPRAGESALFDFGLKPGYSNLRLAVSHVYAPGDSYSEPPGGSSNYLTGSGQWWKMLRGYAPLGDFTTTDVYYEHPSFVEPSFLLVTGDPVARTGWLQGTGDYWPYSPGDARFNMGTGPFQMAPGDTQEIVFAVIGGLGGDHLSSITVLRHNARHIRSVYKNLFEPLAAVLPALPYAVPLDQSIVLIWGHDSLDLAERNSAIRNYALEGYTIHQVPGVGAPLSSGTRLGTFDRVNNVWTITDDRYDPSTRSILTIPVQFGTDRGLQRHMIVRQDSAGLPLRNGTEYHFAVTAYNHTLDPEMFPRSVESEPAYVSATPGRPVHARLAQSVGDTLEVQHTDGSGTTRIAPVSLDPFSGTGDTYEIRFDSSAGIRSWSLSNVTRGTVILNGQTTIDDRDEFRIVEGGVLLMMEEAGASPSTAGDVYRYTVATPERSDAIARENVKRFGVFPNPFTVANVRNELEVTFTNLPERAIIRIYNLAGHLVRVLEKDSPSPFMHWDMQNKDGWLVASGIYICYAEFPDLGTHGIVKLGVVTSVINY